MNVMQTITIYFRVVYLLAALIFGGYVAGLVLGARRARARLDAASSRRP